jgi:hypothetical protein
MAERTVTITLIPGEPATGLWCDRCALPSRIEVPLYMATSRGVSTLRTVAYCAEHGSDKVQGK